MTYEIGPKINGFDITKNNLDLIYRTTCGKIGIFDTVKCVIKEDAVLSDKSLFQFCLLLMRSSSWQMVCGES
jgi:hypothetical protein